METFTGLSWHEAIGMAVQLLPGATIQWDSDDEAVISIIVEPEAGPCVLRFIHARFYSTFRDHGWPRDLDYLLGPGGSAENMADRSIVAICGERGSDEQLTLADQISTEDLAGKILRMLSGMLGHNYWAANAINRAQSAQCGLERGSAPDMLPSKWNGVSGQPRWLHVLTGLESPCVA